MDAHDPSEGPEDADRETASAGYAARFAGPVGAWFLDVQARATLELMSRWPAARVLDVGGGHAQLATPLAGAGCHVTVLGSAPDAGRRLESLRREGRVRFVVGPLDRAPFPDRSFDVVLAFRLLPHARRWPALVAELARLTNHAVIVDYPSRRSVNAVAESAFSIKKSIEGNTRPFQVFADAEIEAAFAHCGLRRTARRAQYLFPMALHRAVGSAAASRLAEGVARLTGLTAALGSPVILRLERG